MKKTICKIALIVALLMLVTVCLTSCGSNEKKAEEVKEAAAEKVEEVKETVKHISSYDYLYGKWEHFHALKKGQFPWGHVEIGLDIDNSTNTIRNITIASDSLDTDIIQKTELLLRGHSSLVCPSSDDSISNDIINLIYE